MEFEKANSRIHLAATKIEKKKLKQLADKYASGNLSLYLVFCGLHFGAQVNIEQMQSRRHLKDQGATEHKLTH